MERRGFIHDMLDVKVLILYIMNRVLYPVDSQKIYELCYQDDCLSYFDVQEALPQMVETGHLTVNPDGTYEITEKGKETCAITEDSVAYPVMQKAQTAVERFNREVRRSSFVKTEIQPRDSGDYSVLLALDDDISNLLSMELMAPSKTQARRMTAAFEKNAETIFQTIMELLVEEPKPEESAPAGRQNVPEI